MASHRHHRSLREHWLNQQTNIYRELWETFWNPPNVACPKCGSTSTEFYDPFFFSPVRTFTGKRRIKCASCRFIWRPSRRGKSLWDRFRPVM